MESETNLSVRALLKEVMGWGMEVPQERPERDQDKQKERDMAQAVTSSNHKRTKPKEEIAIRRL